MLKNLKYHKSSEDAFTLVEAVVAALVFAAVAVGLFATSSALKKPSVLTDKRLTAAFYGKQILEDLRAKVDQRDWNNSSGPLWQGDHVTQPIYNPTYNVSYSISYTVSNIVGSSARKVDVTVTWPD